MKPILAMMRRLLRRVGISDAGSRSSRLAPDWAAVADYYALYRAVPKARFDDTRSFLEGPFARYLELAEAAPGAPGARIMEHAGASLRWFRDKEAAEGRSTEQLDADAAAMVRVRFPAGTPNGRYMLDVFEGRATHNYRASDEEEG